MPKRIYENDRIRVQWDSDRCMHSENCVKGLPSVFNRDRKPWVNVGAGSATEIARVIDTCPSGALRYELVADERSAQICVLGNGPYRVEGGVRLLKEDGSQLETDECFVLCRCGASRKKPFCDGTHIRAGFRDDTV